MSRVKGYYICLGERRESWLDTTTGAVYESQNSTAAVAQGFKWNVATGECRWGCGFQFHFIPDLVAQDWYVMRFIPEGVLGGETRPARTVTTGPYTEATARLQAVTWTEHTKSRSCKVAVVQLLAGNTLTREQPPAPAPVLVWS